MDRPRLEYEPFLVLKIVIGPHNFRLGENFTRAVKEENFILCTFLMHFLKLQPQKTQTVLFTTKSLIILTTVCILHMQHEGKS
jgi:hypothetical protein